MPPRSCYHTKINSNSSICIRPRTSFRQSHPLHIIRSTTNTDTTTVKNQITQHNRFLTQHKHRPHPQYQSRHHEPKTQRTFTRLTIRNRPRTNIPHRKIRQMVGHSKKKYKQDQARTDIDQIINNTIFPDSQIKKIVRSDRHNINSVLISYNVVLQKESTPTTI